MKNLLSIAILGILILFYSCSSTKSTSGLTEETGYFELPYPSNNFKPGQVVEIHKNPAKVELTHQPNIIWEQMNSSPGPNISSSKRKEVKKLISSKISGILGGKYEKVSSENVKVNITNTITTIVPTSIIYSELNSELKKNSVLKRQFEDSMNRGVVLRAITSTLRAKISIIVVDSSNQTLELDSDAVNKLNSELGLGFTKGTTGNRIITGEGLIIGVHTNPNIIKDIMKNL